MAFLPSFSLGLDQHLIPEVQYIASRESERILSEVRDILDCSEYQLESGASSDCYTTEQGLANLDEFLAGIGGPLNPVGSGHEIRQGSFGLHASLALQNYQVTDKETMREAPPPSSLNIGEDFKDSTLFRPSRSSFSSLFGTDESEANISPQSSIVASYIKDAEQECSDEPNTGDVKRWVRAEDAIKEMMQTLRPCNREKVASPGVAFSPYPSTPSLSYISSPASSVSPARTPEPLDPTDHDLSLPFSSGVATEILPPTSCFKAPITEVEPLSLMSFPFDWQTPFAPIPATRPLPPSLEVRELHPHLNWPELLPQDAENIIETTVDPRVLCQTNVSPIAAFPSHFPPVSDIPSAVSWEVYSHDATTISFRPYPEIKPVGEGTTLKISKRKRKARSTGDEDADDFQPPSKRQRNAAIASTSHGPLYCLHKDCKDPHKLFPNLKERNRHMDTHFPHRFACPACRTTFSRPESVKRHLNEKNGLCNRLVGPRKDFAMRPPYWQDAPWRDCLKVPLSTDPLYPLAIQTRLF